jgi:hypothetical protein
MNVLTLHLKQKWWEQIRDGVKTVELRHATEYWRRRLVGKSYDEVHLYCGYPKRGDTSKLLVRKWTGIAKETILHEEFGDKPVDVFVIGLGVKESGKNGGVQNEAMPHI